jgi:uncharacterized protein (DUF2164 family)
MMDGKTYDDVVKLFLGGEWRDRSCAMSVFGDGIFISVYPGSFRGTPLTMRFDVDLFIKIADWLREEDEEIEDCDDEMDMENVILARLDDLEDRVVELEKPEKPVYERPIKGGRCGGFYGTEFPNLGDLRFYNLG